MKTNKQEAVGRLKTLCAKRGEDQVFARMHVPLPADLRDDLSRRAAALPAGEMPGAELMLPLWDEYLAFYDGVEDDSVPSIYPRQYDQGIYGTLFGAEMAFNSAETPGWASSGSRPLEGRTYDELVQLALNPDDEWLQRMEKDLRYFATASSGPRGVSVAITIDALNLCQQIRGNDTFLDLYDQPDELRRFLQAAVDLNINVVERQRAAIGSTYEGGVYDFFNAGWMPDGGIPMSVDCYNLCSADVYSEFGRPYQQQLIDHFGGGNFHLHGNGRHLLPELAKLRGCVMCLVSDDGSDTAAFDDLAAIKRQAGPVIPVVGCAREAFIGRLREGSLVGGVYYTVGPLETVNAANRLMEHVRAYRA